MAQQIYSLAALIFLSLVYEVIVNILSFFSSFLYKDSVCSEKYRDPDYAVDPLANYVKSHFNYPPLFHHEYWTVSGFQSYNT